MSFLSPSAFVRSAIARSALRYGAMLATLLIAPAIVRAQSTTTASAATRSATGTATGTPPGTPPGTATSAATNVTRREPAPPPAEPTVGAALRRAADKHGVWGSVGVGQGRAGLDCTTCASKQTKAYSLQGTIGMRVTPRFLIGVETFAWLDVIGGGVDRIARGNYVIARSYPVRTSRLFLHGGLGVASFEVNDGEVAFKTRSPSLSMGLGYDWRLGGLSLTPSVTAIGSTGGRLNSDRTGNAITDNARLGYLRSALAFSWYR